MAFTRLSFGKLWTSRDDFPTLEDSEAQVREDFQYHPDAIKKYLNEVLLAELEGKGGAGLIGASDGSVQKMLDDLAKSSGGGASGAGSTAQVAFEAKDWVQASSGYSLYIPKSSHNRGGAAFGCDLRSVVNGEPVSNTWDVACTSVEYDGETEGITLMSERAYAGVAVFFGQ